MKLYCSKCKTEVEAKRGFLCWYCPECHAILRYKKKVKKYEDIERRGY